MSSDELDTTGSSSAIHSFAEEDMRANEEHERLQMLEIEKKRLEIEIDQLEQEIAADSAESFSRDQLATVRSELEHNSNELFAQRTNRLLMKLEETRTERQSLQRRVAHLKDTLQTEHQLTKQLVDERAAQRPPNVLSFPEFVLPDLQTLQESYRSVHRRRALEEEIRDAERQLSQRRQQIAENESRLSKVIQESRATSAQCEAQIRSDAIELAQLEETRSALRERIEENCQKQKQLNLEKRNLAAQIEAAEAAQRAKIDEIHRNFLAAQREFDEVRARKQAEIRELTRQLHENEELNRCKLQEKEIMIQEITSRTRSRADPRRRARPKKVQQTARPVATLQAEINDLQRTKDELMAKLQDIQKKTAASEKKLGAIKSNLARKVAESERQIRRLRGEKQAPGDLPPRTFGSDDGSSVDTSK
jgi:chromosome segregation ATPase